VTTPDGDACALLDALGVAYRRFDHPAVFTCEEAERAVPDTGALHTKNLFLRDKRGRRHVLVVTTCARAVNLKALADRLGIDNLSFASPDRLAKHLGVAPGSVTVLGLMRDSARAVEVVIDEEVWTAERLHAHPLVNTATLVLEHEGLVRFLGHTGHRHQVLRF
jgi:Ala-tRNA(Pro) deacylase